MKGDPEFHYIMPNSRSLTKFNLQKMAMEQNPKQFYEILPGYEGELDQLRYPNYKFLDLYIEFPGVNHLPIQDFLQNLPIGRKLNLTGPYGTGLRLTSKFLQSRPHIAVFVEGVHIVKFLDLVYYLLV